jgi:coenzyme F420-dependent glucose-6-phosphate dehydrogenase
MSVALDRTWRIKVGPVVTSPIGGRYHPVIIGQASATLDNMYPGRFLLGVGSGEAMSEAVFFNEGWPKWHERTERLVEAIAVMKKMWESRDYFSFQGKYFKLDSFFLYTKPKAEIPIYFAASGEKAVAYAGKYGDHLVTINSPQRCRDVVFPAFESAARSVGKDPSKMEKMVEIPLCYAGKDHGPEEARRLGDAAFLAEGAFNERDPRKIEQMSRDVSDEKIIENISFFSSPDSLIEIIDDYWTAGATHIEIVTHSFADRIELLGKKVLPYFAKSEKYAR